MQQTKNILVQCDIPGRPLIIAFGDLGGSREKGFQFRNSLSSFQSCNVVFCKDVHRSWHYRGIIGFSSSFEETLENLRPIIRDANPTRLICIGHSSGGYTALVMGMLLNADRIIAIVPQTTIDPDVRIAMGDKRWNAEAVSVRALNSATYEAYKDVLKMACPAHTRISIVVGTEDHFDMLYAQRIENWCHKDKVTMLYKTGNHDTLGRTIAANGVLASIISSALN